MPSDDTEAEHVTAADLDGTQWRLMEIDYGQPALDQPAVTLAFEGDTFGGSGGCNSYSGGFALGEENPFVLTVGPVASTMMACPGSDWQPGSGLLCRAEQPTRSSGATTSAISPSPMQPRGIATAGCCSCRRMRRSK